MSNWHMSDGRLMHWGWPYQPGGPSSAWCGLLLAQPWRAPVGAAMCVRCFRALAVDCAEHSNACTCAGCVWLSAAREREGVKLELRSLFDWAARLTPARNLSRRTPGVPLRALPAAEPASGSFGAPGYGGGAPVVSSAVAAALRSENVTVVLELLERSARAAHSDPLQLLPPRAGRSAQAGELARRTHANPEPAGGSKA